MGPIRSCCIVVPLALWAAATAAAQDHRALPPAWSLTVGRGLGATSAGHSIEDAMIAGGYGIRTCDFLCTGVPSSEGVASGWELTARRRINRMVHVGILFATSGGTRTFGRYLTGFLDSTTIPVRPSVTTIALAVGLNAPNDIFFGSAGVGSFHAKIDGDGELMSGKSTSGTHIGAIIVAGVRYPSSSERGFAELRGEYRAAGTIQMGAIPVPAHGSSGAGEIPASGINFNHWMIEIALGIRIK